MLERTHLRGDQMCLLNTIVRGVEAAQDEEAAEAAEEHIGGDSSEVFQRAEQGVRSLTTSSKGSSFISLDSALQQRFAQSNSRALKAAQTVLHAHNVSGERYRSARHLDVMQIVYTSEKVQFVNAANYRSSGPRSDPVELLLEDGSLAPAKIIAFFQTVHEGVEDLALVQWFHVITERDPVMLQSRCELRQSHDTKSYSVVSTQAISGHAHMIPDFDAPVGKSWYWWDVIY